MITLVKCHDSTNADLLRCAEMFLESDSFDGQDVKLIRNITCVDEEAPINGIMAIDQDDEVIGYLVPNEELTS